MEYPKTFNLYKRDPNTHKLTAEYSKPEFYSVNNWLVTEKIDGTNIRITYSPWHGVLIQGRTNNANPIKPLWAKLEQMFTDDALGNTFSYDTNNPDYKVILYGEGYGPGIQKGGGDYSPEVSFRLFDVRIGNYWLEWDDVCGVADSLGIKTVPVLSTDTRTSAVVRLVRPEMISQTALEDKQYPKLAEGIVATAVPQLFNRYGERVKFKLKVEDIKKLAELG